jgi:hypothetical protein
MAPQEFRINLASRASLSILELTTSLSEQKLRYNPEVYFRIKILSFTKLNNIFYEIVLICLNYVSNIISKLSLNYMILQM